MNSLDDFDLRILSLLQADGDLTHTQLAENVHLSATQCARRLQRLRNDGFIQRFVALLDPKLLGLTVAAHMQVSLRIHDQAGNKGFRAFVAKADEVVECYAQTGDADFLLKVVLRDLAHLSTLIDRMISATGGLASIRSSIVLHEIKRTTALPLIVN